MDGKTCRSKLALVQGTFGPSTRQTACQSCALGFISSTQAAVRCEPCGVGTYVNSTGQTVCVPCPKGTALLARRARG
jgi:hypothetical protein